MQGWVFRGERVWMRVERNVEGEASLSPDAGMSAGQAGRCRPPAGRLLGGTPDGVPERARPRRRDRGPE